MKNLIKLKRFNSISEAELTKNLLKCYNIQAQVAHSGIEFPGDRGDAFGADLFVQEEDFEKAKEILEDSNKNQKTKLMQNEQQNLNQQFQPATSPKPKFNLKYILIILILAILAGGGIFAYTKYIYKQIPETEKLVISDQTANWQTYRNEEMGIEFKYPKFWGEVRTDRFQGPTECELWERIASGTEIRLTFSENYFITLYFNSPDYKSAICFADREEVMPGFTKEEELTCEPYPIGISRVFECSRSSIANSPAITWYNAIEGVQACGYDIDRHIKLISPNQNFPGLHIIAFIRGSGYDTGCNEEEHYGPDITLEEFVKLRLRQLKEGQLPFEARQSLWESDNFIQSIKFTQ